LCDGAKFARVTNEAETRNDIVRVLGVTATQLRVKLGESKDSVARFNQPLELATSRLPMLFSFWRWPTKAICMVICPRRWLITIELSRRTRT